MVFLVFWDSIPNRCKGVHRVDLVESFPTHIFLQNLASILPRTSPVKFARSRAGNGRARPTGPANASPDFERSSRATAPSLASRSGVVANFWQNFARFRLYRRRSLQVNTKYAFCSSLQNLPDYLSGILEISKFRKILKILQH